jgi:hypothetical protein
MVLNPIFARYVRLTRRKAFRAKFERVNRNVTRVPPAWYQDGVAEQWSRVFATPPRASGNPSSPSTENGQ